MSISPLPLYWGWKKTEKKKINQNDIWLVSSEVKPSHVENRPGTVLWVQKIGWANSSLKCNYLLKTKQNKKCSRVDIPLRDRYLSNLCTTRIQLCNVRVNRFACGLCNFSMLLHSTGADTMAQPSSQDARNASFNFAHFYSPTASSLVQVSFLSYTSICNSSLMVSLPLSICSSF